MRGFFPVVAKVPTVSNPKKDASSEKFGLLPPIDSKKSKIILTVSTDYGAPFRFRSRLSFLILTWALCRATLNYLISILFVDSNSHIETLDHTMQKMTQKFFKWTFEDEIQKLSPIAQQIVAGAKTNEEKAIRIFNFVRDEIKFGFTEEFDQGK